MERNKNESPLVSIIVITYNSTKYVLETLESAKAQTYQNIELIVSDDCSTDDTVEICRKWIEENKDRFVRTELITVDKNTGIPANCNRGVKAAKGDWLKLIAGDDTLTVNAIVSYIIYVNNCDNREISFIHASMNYFNNKIEKNSFLGVIDKSENIFNHPNCKAAHQFEMLLRDVQIGAPSVFIRKTKLDEVGGFDEEMPYDDWPIYFKFSLNGLKLFYMKKVTVNYRLHNSSFYNNQFQDSYIFNPFYKKDRVVFNRYIKNYLPIFERSIYMLEFKRKSLFESLGLNKRNFFNNLINYPFLMAFNFYKKYSRYKLKRRIKKCII